MLLEPIPCCFSVFIQLLPRLVYDFCIRFLDLKNHCIKDTIYPRTDITSGIFLQEQFN